MDRRGFGSQSNCNGNVLKANSHKPLFKIYEDDVSNENDIPYGKGKWNNLQPLREQNKENDIRASKWTELVPDFLTYFLNQWMVSDSFGSWKVYCSAPGKAVL